MMNNNIHIDTQINDLGEKNVDYNYKNNGDVDSSCKVIGNDQTRISNFNVVVKDQILGEYVGLIDSIDVDEKVKESKEFSGSVVRKGKSDKERRMKRIEKVEKFNGFKGFGENGYVIGDLVWGKVKSHPWWPGHIFNEKLASPEVCRLKTDGYVLVAFFGDCSYGWFDPSELVPFESGYAEKSRQMSSRTFVKAVEETVDEASRRRSLGLACRCRNSYNFRPTSVEGYFAVDVGDYESGSMYSVDQIRKSRDAFKPTEVLDFVNQLALSPINVKHEAIDFVKDKATVLAYRKAVYDEFDETYAQAFGYEPKPPSRAHTQGLNQPPKVANPAPLSGPLVIAEVLGKGKGSAKSHKSKERVKKDQYLFKRRDEVNDLKTSVHVLPSQDASSEQPVYVDGSLANAAGEQALQKKSKMVSKKLNVSAKHQGTECSARDEVLDLRPEAGGKGEMSMDDKPSGMEFGHADSRMNFVNSSNNKPVGEDPSQFCQANEAKPLQNEGKVVGLESQESSRSEVGVGHAGINTSDSDIPCPVDVKHDRARLMAIKSVESPEQSLSEAAKTEVHGEQSHDGYVGHALGTGNAKSPKEGPDINNGIQVKKVKVRKRPAEKLKSENSLPLIKKKRKKELLSSENMKSGPSGGEVELSEESVAKSPVHVPTSSREDLHLHVEPLGKETMVSFETILAQKMISHVEKIELEPLQLLHSLKAFAHGIKGGSDGCMIAVRQALLKYRSLYFEKSLALLPATDIEPPADTKAIDIPAKDVRERSLIKPHRQVARPDDPSKGGLKRGPSDRQEEISANKKKKINDIKLLKAKKKVTQKTMVLPRVDLIKEASEPTKKSLKPTPLKEAQPTMKSLKSPHLKETSGPTMKSLKPAPLKEASGPTIKSLKPAPLKKTEPSSRALDPMMLVMKFPPQGTLPSIMELKARFARFGQLDHSATRIFWKTSTCRLVYRRRVDAESACRFASSNQTLFGNTDVTCYTREVGGAEPVTEPCKAHMENTSMGTSQLRDLAIEQRPARSLPLRTLQQSGLPKSILKKSNGDETSSTNGGGKGTRVKFILGEEETNRGGEPLMIGNKNMNNASFVDGGTSSSTHHGLDFNSKNIVIPTSPMPMLPVPTVVQSIRSPNYLHHTKLAPRTGHNFNIASAPSMTHITPNKDISQQMMGLLNKCNDVVHKLTDVLGYAPLHPL